MRTSRFMILILLMGGITIVAGNIFMKPTVAQQGDSNKFSNVFVTSGYEEVGSTTGVVKTITSGLLDIKYPHSTQRAYITVSGQGIRYLCSGDIPTTDFGNPMPVGSWFQVVSHSDILNFKFINDDDTGTATCHINLQGEWEMKQ